MSKIGLVFFNNVTTPSSGMAYHNGDVFSFGSISELDMSVAWIVDLPYKSFQDSGFNKHAHLRPSQYLRVGLTGILRELGLKKNIEGAEVLGSLADSIVNDLGEMIGANPYSQPYRLNYDALKLLLPNYYADFSINQNAAVSAAIDNAYQASQGAHKTNNPNNAKLQHFTFPRVAHFEYLMNQNFPINHIWKEMDLFKTPIITGVKKGKQLENFDEISQQLKVLHTDTACILNIHVKSIEDTYMQGFAFGVEGAKSNIRVWAALPEVIDIMRYTEVEIVGGYETAASKLPLRPEIDLTINRYSYPRGIVAENIWVALSEKISINSVKHSTGIGVYLRAYDRLICGKLAEAFALERYKVGGFGNGAVRVWARSQEADKLNAIASRYGAIPDLKG